MRYRNNRYAGRSLVNSLLGQVDSFENNADDAPMGQVAANMQTQIAPMKGNPPFDAQFDVQVLIKYFTVSTGTYTLRTAAYVLANAAALATQLAFFVFGITDFNGGFKKLRTQFPLSGGWAYESPFIYGNGYPATSLGVLDAT